MNKLSLLTMAALSALAACAAAARPAEPTIAATVAPAAIEAAAPTTTYVRPAAARGDISCDVRSRRTANGVLIQARAFAERAFDGEYDLVITKTGGGGSADINQGGPVSLDAGSSVTLGENEIGLERGARVHATLTLRDDSGQICRRSFNL